MFAFQPFSLDIVTMGHWLTCILRAEQDKEDEEEEEEEENEVDEEDEKQPCPKLNEQVTTKYEENMSMFDVQRQEYLKEYSSWKYGEKLKTVQGSQVNALNLEVRMEKTRKKKLNVKELRQCESDTWVLRNRRKLI